MTHRESENSHYSVEIKQDQDHQSVTRGWDQMILYLYTQVNRSTQPQYINEIHTYKPKINKEPRLQITNSQGSSSKTVV